MFAAIGVVPTVATSAGEFTRALVTAVREAAERRPGALTRALRYALECGIACRLLASHGVASVDAFVCSSARGAMGR